jgi:hypothetical protein
MTRFCGQKSCVKRRRKGFDGAQDIEKAQNRSRWGALTACPFAESEDGHAQVIRCLGVVQVQPLHEVLEGV